MVNNLVLQIIERLRTGFAGVLAAPASRIVAGPVPTPAVGDVPRLALYLGKLEFAKSFQETSAGQPRPTELKEELEVQAGNAQGPYQLAKTPLEKSLNCKVLFNQGPLNGRRILMLENTDFALDYQTARMTFTKDLQGAAAIFLRYAYVGVFTVKEFEQEIIMEAYDQSSGDAERWASLAIGMIFSDYETILQKFNETTKTVHVANAYLSEHTINKIYPIGATIEKIPDRNVFKYSFSLQVSGQTKFVKEIIGGFGIIESIHSPGKIPTGPVDIDIDID